MFKFTLLVAFFFGWPAWSQNLKLFVSLNPAGDFVAESDQVSGQAIENADGSVEATNIKVPVKSLKSGISLRDEHMANKYLEAAKYPDITLKIAKGKDAKGLAILIIKGKEAKVSGTYVKSKDLLKAIFKVKISDFGIENINYKGIGVEDEAKLEVVVPLVKAASVKPQPKVAAPVKKSSTPIKKMTTKK